MNRRGIYFVLVFAFCANFGWSQPPPTKIKGFKKPNPFLPADYDLVDSLMTLGDNHIANGNDSLGYQLILQATVENKVRGWNPERNQVDRRYIELLKSLGAYQFALYQFQEDLKMYRHHNWKVIPGFYTTGASVFLKLGMCDSVKYYMRLALDWHISANNNEYPKSASPYNSIGYLYYKCGDLDSAEYFLDKGFQHFHNIKPDTNIFYFLQDNLFQIRLDQNELEEAGKLAESNYTYFKKKGIRYHTALSSFRKIQYLYKAKKLDSIPYFVNEFQKNIDDKFSRDLELWNTFYKYLDRIAPDFMNQNQLENFRSEKYSFDEERSANRLKHLDFVLQYMSEKMLQNRMRRDRLFDLHIQKDRQRAQHHNDRYRAFTLIAIILLVLIIVSILFIIRIISIKRRNENLTKQQLENEKSILELELENKNLAQIQYEQRLKLQKQESVEMALEIKRKRQWFNEIKDKLNTIRSPEDASQVIKDIIPNSIVDEKQELFKERVDELNKEYFENLLGKHPELTQIEKELCGLIKLNLNTKEIASTRGVTVNAIKVARRRLRKKLGITKDVDLYEYLQKI